MDPTLQLRCMTHKSGAILHLMLSVRKSLKLFTLKLKGLLSFMVDCDMEEVLLYVKLVCKDD